jgi:hypothetical protein
LVVKARDTIAGWKPRPDDDDSFATFRKLYPAAQIDRTVRELAVYQAARNGNRYKDPRLALGKWLKRQAPEKRTADDREPAPEGMRWACFTNSVTNEDEYRLVPS